jgi:hypothetical protein
MEVTLEPERILKEKFILKIDKEGNWFYNDLPIINKKIYLFFNQHIEKDSKAGYILRVENETCQLVVEDTPYVVAGIAFVDSDPEKGEYFRIRLNDETEEELDMESFFIGKDNVPYCRVKNGEFPARFLRAPYYCLAEHIHQETEDRFYILLNRKKFYINTAS